jgi:hypothetical protein
MYCGNAAENTTEKKANYESANLKNFLRGNARRLRLGQFLERKNEHTKTKTACRRKQSALQELKPVGWEQDLQDQKPREDNWNLVLAQDLYLFETRHNCGGSRGEHRLETRSGSGCKNEWIIFTCFQQVAADSSSSLQATSAMLERQKVHEK